VSAKDGRLTLTFRTLKAGDKVSLISVKKMGYELFNKSATDQWNLSGAGKPFTIVMVRSDYFSQLKEKVTQVSSDNYKAQYIQATKELEAQKNNGKLQEEAFNRKLEELENKYNESIKMLNNYIDKFVRIDQSEVSPEEQHLLDLVRDGRFDEAVKAYDGMQLLEQLEKEIGHFNDLTLKKKTIGKEIDIRRSNIKDLYAIFQRQLSTLLLAGKHRKAEENLEKALETISPLYDKNPDEYRPYVMELQYELSDLLIHHLNYGSDLDDLYDNRNKALAYGMKALENFQIMSNQGQETNLEILAKIQRNIGDIHEKSDNHVYISLNAAEYWLASEETYKLLSTNHPEAHRAELASIYVDLSELYARQHYDNKKAIDYQSLAVENYLVLAEQEADKYLETLAKEQWRLGKLLEDENRQKAEPYMLASIENYEKLIEKDYEKYEHDLESRYREMGWFYANIKTYEKATAYLETSLEMQTKRVESNPDSEFYTYHLQWLAVAHWEMCFMYSYRYLRNFDMVRKYAHSCLEIYSKVVELDPKYNWGYEDMQKEIGELLERIRQAELRRKSQ
jgi:tetratricopeptide (TPR) repeat protein